MSKIIGITRLAVRFVVHVLPIDKECVYVYNILDRYNDSVKYVVDKLHNRHSEYKIIWDNPETIELKGTPEYITKVKRGSVTAAYYQTRAFLCLDSYIGIHSWLYKKNDTLREFIAKIKLQLMKNPRQMNLSTFHGVPYKYIGAKRYGDHAKDYDFTTSCDYFICGNRFEVEVYMEAYPGQYEFKFLGKANTDILFDNEKHEELKRKLGLPIEKKLILYAPTFREWSVENVGLKRMKEINIEEVLRTLQDRFGGEWAFGFRVHHYVLTRVLKEPFLIHNTGLIVNCNEFDDMAEYMSCCDAFMTDYSSSILDAMQTEKPSFLYVDDYKEYMEKEADYTLK